LKRKGIAPAAIIEPTCGIGAFIKAALVEFPDLEQFFGVEINEEYVAQARENAGPKARVEAGDFFVVDWEMVLSSNTGPWLVLGNPPWVTNTELGVLGSSNLPTKSNFQRHKGLDAITGKANFDISEWMLLNQLNWLRKRSGWIAMLVKTSVARKVLRQVWRRGDPVGRSAIYKIDAMQYFGAAVDACLFLLPISQGENSLYCDVFDGLEDRSPSSTLGFHDRMLVSDVEAYMRHRELVGENSHYTWRSGVKHDCSKVMELSKNSRGELENGLGERVDIEDDNLFPLLKSSDVAKERTKTNRYMLVTQRKIGADTAYLASCAPKTWKYLIRHADLLDARRSIIYQRKPRFSIFGVGSYTFAPWKIAISGFYKTLNFIKVGPVDGKPIVMDDTIYFVPCRSESEADQILSIVRSGPFTELMDAMAFLDEKRPITAELLKRISIDRVANILGLTLEVDNRVQTGAQQHFSFAAPQI